MTSCFEFLKLQQAKGRTIIYIPNPGNLGDSLIACATVQQLKKNNISYELLQRNISHSRNNLYVYGGGGNLVPYYNDAKNLLNLLSPFKASFCILPHSCFGADDALLSYQGDLTIFARERKTYDYLQGLSKPDLKIELSHDLALSLDMSDPRLAMPDIFKRLYGVRNQDLAASEIYVFRKDREAASQPQHLLAKSVDFSLLWPRGFPSNGFHTVLLDEPLIFNSSAWLLSLVAPAQIVHTDRLHVGIAACMLGKEVHFYDNSYGKISSVYAHSIATNPAFNARLHG